MKIEVKRFIDAAHKLPDTEDLVTKECARLHGHTYYIIVEAEGIVNDSGMITDFKNIKNIIDKLDHRYINDVFIAEKYNHAPTAENIALYYKKKISEELEELNNIRVSVCEGYKGELQSSWVHTS